jgi:selenide,water dikinase
METNARLTRLASCAGCGAKVGAGTLASLLGDFKTRTDPNLIVGFDRSDDASVYVVNDETALIQTVDFFPPIVDDPYLFGQIAAANAISDIYAMGGEPKLALNVMCVTDSMEEAWIREILRGGYDKAYEAGVIISGGHTIRGSEPLYGMAVTGFAHPAQIRRNDAAKPGDALILTKPLGVGILTTAMKAELVEPGLRARLYRQMATLNRDACRAMQRYRVHGCTDVTGFGLLGHSCEMAQGSGCTLHILVKDVPFHREALELADMGLVPAGAYRNRDFAEGATLVRGDVSRAMQDILYDPQTSGGLLIAVDERDAAALQGEIEGAAVIGYVTEREEKALVLEDNDKSEYTNGPI